MSVVCFGHSDFRCFLTQSYLPRPLKKCPLGPLCEQSLYFEHFRSGTCPWYLVWWYRTHWMYITWRTHDIIFVGCLYLQRNTVHRDRVFATWCRCGYATIGNRHTGDKIRIAWVSILLLLCACRLCFTVLMFGTADSAFQLSSSYVGALVSYATRDAALFQRKFTTAPVPFATLHLFRIWPRHGVFCALSVYLWPHHAPFCPLDHVT